MTLEVAIRRLRERGLWLARSGPAWVVLDGAYERVAVGFTWREAFDKAMGEASP